VKAKDEARVRSWVLLLAGLAGIGYQQWTGESNIILLLIFTAMTGVPGLNEIISLIRNSPIVLQSSASRQQLLDQDSDTPAIESSSKDEK
jgi:hypothetical protein